MAAIPSKSQWKSLGGTSRQYANIETGEIISRRRFDEMFNKLTYETKAAHNKAINPEKAILRPARGRKSYVKAQDWIQKEIAAQRFEAAEKKKKEAESRKREREIQRTVQRKAKKKVKPRKVAKRYIPKNKLGWRVSFNDYQEYLTLLEDARKTGVIKIYGLGFVGVDSRTGIEKGVTVFRMRSISITESEDEFYGAMEDALNEYSYLDFMHYYIHLAISVDYVKGQK